jgi:hypothetical protein
MSRLAAIRYARQHGTWRLWLARIMERRPIKVAAGEPTRSIGRRFDRESSSIFSVISPTGGIRSPDRHRAKRALSFSEREEISRWLSMRRSLRSITRHLGRSVSIVSRKASRNGGVERYRAAGSDQAAWDRARRPKLCKLACRFLEADSIRCAKAKCSAIASRFSPRQWEMSLVGSYREPLREKVRSSASSCRTRGYVARAASMSGCSSATLGHQRAGREIRR